MTIRTSLTKPSRMNESVDLKKNARIHFSMSKGALHVKETLNTTFNQSTISNLKKPCKSIYIERYGKRLKSIKRRCERLVLSKKVNNSPKRECAKPNTSYSKVRSKLDEVSFNKSFNAAVQNYWRYASPFQGEYKVINKKIIWKPTIDPTITYFYHKTQKKSNTKIQSTKHKDPSLAIQYACASKAGQIKNKPKTNQDSMLICPKLCGKDDLYLFAIADGHGCFGSNVSQMILTSLKCKLLIKPRSFRKALTRILRRNCH